MLTATRSAVSEADRRAPQRANVRPLAPPGVHAQRAFGNHAMARAAHAASDSAGGGPFAPDEDVAGGPTVGEALGDVVRPIGTLAGNVFGAVVGAVAGNSISSATTSAAVWNPHGHFHWEVGFSTSGRNGWLIQKIQSTRRAEDASGAALPDTLPPVYWEAWQVDGTGNVGPIWGTTNDFWNRRSFGNNTQGHWSIYSAVYFTATDPATQGFSTTAVTEANGLLASRSEPTGLGITRLHRFAQGTWDSTTATPTHTGSAGPQ